MHATPLSRRQLIRTGLAGSLTAALAVWVGPERAGARQPRVPLHAVLLDERFPEALRFGASARRHGLSTRNLQGDVTDLWYGELYPLWKERAVPIAGLTTYAALFCLEQLAWDHRMRVVYRGAHVCRADGEFGHALAGPHALVGAIRSAPSSSWPAELASAIALIESRGGWSGLAPVPLRHTRLVPDGAPTLYSWLISAPART